MRRTVRTLLTVAIFMALAAIPVILLRPHGTSSKNHSSGASNTIVNQPAPASFDKHAHSLDDPASIWIVVNKKRPLSPKTYAPNDLRAPHVPLRLSGTNGEMLMRDEAASALEAMAAAAEQDGAHLMVASAYRSYDFQKNLYNRYVSQQGQAVADTQSARAGYSEHQTGLAVDLEPSSRSCEVEACFATTTEGKWLAAHAYEYGFIIRYPDGGQGTTGYIYEPWHVRYIGKPLAGELKNRGMPMLEDFFTTGNAADY